MKIFWKAILAVCFLLFLFLFKPRQDILLAAVDKSQYIKLFEQDNEFVICIDENNLFMGTYVFSTDTVYLFYQEHLEYSSMSLNTSQPKQNNRLPKKLFINPEETHIRSTDGSSFSAVIYKDMRNRIFESRSAVKQGLNNRTYRVLADDPQP
jgi:hypothetical protein